MVPDSNFPPMKHLAAKKSARQGKKGALIPFDEFLVEAERLFRMAKETLERDHHHCPILILFTQDLGMEIVGFDVSGGRPFHEYVKGIVQARKARAFVCISEAWMLLGSDAQAALAANVRPSCHPEKRQVLSIAAVHRRGSRMWVVPYAVEGGKVVFGTLLDSAAAGMSVGGGIPEALSRGEEDKP
jgi:hypothetical protein